tara:strand:- start:8167 stop:8868 length:702 start_codon:yes stop_codon:yes gene_type:complete
LIRLITALCRITLPELFRTPIYSVPTVVFPAMLFTFFAAPSGASLTRVATLMTTSFAVYAVVGVGFYQFGVGIAQDRESAWETFTRTLPAPAFPRIFARVISAFVFAGIAAALVVAVAYVLASPKFTIVSGMALAVALAAGLVPFALFGVALRYLSSGKAAVAQANLIFLLLAYIGGLWVLPHRLPDAVAQISPFTPTRQFADLAWAATTDIPLALTPVLGLPVRQKQARHGI